MRVTTERKGCCKINYILACWGTNRSAGKGKQCRRETENVAMLSVGGVCVNVVRQTTTIREKWDDVVERDEAKGHDSLSA